MRPGRGSSPGGSCTSRQGPQAAASGGGGLGEVMRSTGSRSQLGLAELVRDHRAGLSSWPPLFPVYPVTRVTPPAKAPCCTTVSHDKPWISTQPPTHCCSDRRLAGTDTDIERRLWLNLSPGMARLPVSAFVPRVNDERKGRRPEAHEEPEQSSPKPAGAAADAQLPQRTLASHHARQHAGMSACGCFCTNGTGAENHIPTGLSAMKSADPDYPLT